MDGSADRNSPLDFLRFESSWTSRHPLCRAGRSFPLKSMASAREVLPEPRGNEGDILSCSLFLSIDRSFRGFAPAVPIEAQKA